MIIAFAHSFSAISAWEPRLTKTWRLHLKWGADQKSGYSLLFETYLKSCTPPVALQMSTFYGHRINILFFMAAAVYYHNDDIKDFFVYIFCRQIK
jgi:hypothetical protein